MARGDELILPVSLLFYNEKLVDIFHGVSNGSIQPRPVNPIVTIGRALLNL